MKDTPVIVAINPTDGLNAATQKEISNNLKKLSANKLVIVLADKNEQQVLQPDRTVEFKNQKIVKDSHPNDKTAHDNVVVLPPLPTESHLSEFSLSDAKLDFTEKQYESSFNFIFMRPGNFVTPVFLFFFALLFDLLYQGSLSTQWHLLLIFGLLSVVAFFIYYFFNHWYYEQLLKKIKPEKINYLKSLGFSRKETEKVYKTYEKKDSTVGFILESILYNIILAIVVCFMKDKFYATFGSNIVLSLLAFVSISAFIVLTTFIVNKLVYKMIYKKSLKKLYNKISF
ncbi:hypothetical protein [Candidatus Phytoplasma pruni]|uniref:Uncharacterized protein n=1 Tax=Candidatus Phytoplasma pruni TaxID=479893 RepID=A0A851HH31_9MOLU|nr:hypothetical protein [Candidatus Phytoplasma pruni]NWN45584.1 hypothetical protein [Candidatus Phytoplasma pruni]